MPNVLDEASRWLSDQLDEHASSDVLYRRGSLAIPLVAGKAKTTFDAVDSSGMVINIESHDFIISAQNIVIGESQCTPQVGDQVVETVGGELQVYEVMRFGTEQCYRPCDPFNYKLRIHTKYVGIVASL